MNKRGSHVGMILSFVIFITFLIFLYVVVSPSIKTGTDQGKVIDYVYNQIAGNTSSNLTSTSFEISSEATITHDCVLIENILFRLEIPSRIKIKNETGGLQDTYLQTGYYYGPEIDRSNEDNLFFRMYYSPEFDELEEQTINPCTSVGESEYSIGVVKTARYIFAENMIQLIDYYNDEYDSLKEEFEIPANNEFEFEFVENDGTKVSAEQETKSGNIYAEEIPIQYIDEDANIQTGFINIKVW